MNILQIVPRLDLGGVERGVVDFSEYLVRSGHKAVVVSGGGSLLKALEDKGVTHYTLPVDRKSLSSILFCIRELKKIILKEDIDIVHSRSRVPHLIGFFASLKTKAQFVITAHGYYSKHFFSRVVLLPKVVIVPSKSLANYFIEEFGLLHSKLVVIPRGLKIEDFPFKDPSLKNFSCLKLCFIGRISPVKGIEYFIEAVEVLAKNFPHLKAFIVGEAESKYLPYKEFLREKVLKSGLAENVEFLGKREPQEILEEAHFLVLPSLIPESFGRVIIEAQAKGVVPIATNLGGPCEVIRDKETGLLVSPFDSEEIAQKIRTTFSNYSLYSQIVFKAREEVEKNYTLEKMAEKTLKVYEDVQQRFNILVIKLSSLGDVVLGTATFKSLKKSYPSSYLAVLTSRTYASIIDNLDFVDEIFICEDRKPHLQELLKLASLLRRRAFDIVLDLQNNYFSHLLSYLVFPKKSIGFKRKLGFLLDKTEDFKWVKRLDPLSSQKKLLNILGIESIEKPCLKVSPQSSLFIDEILEETGFKGSFLVGINIEASSKWKTKNLTDHSLSELISYILSKGAKVVLMGRKESYSRAERIRQNSPKVLNLCGKVDLKGLVALISKMGLFISPDSAPLHIAIALDIPSLGIFGPTRPERHLVFKENVFVIRNKIPCLGCYKKSCKKNLCMEITLDNFSPIIERFIK